MDRRVEEHFNQLQKMSGRYEFFIESMKRAKKRLKAFGIKANSLEQANDALAAKKEELKDIDRKIGKQLVKIKKTMRTING